MLGRFRRYLLGQDALRIEHHWSHLYRMGPFRGNVLGGALSAVDIALWDIKGKRYEAPVWQLLGGRCRDRVRIHLLIEEGDHGDTILIILSGRVRVFGPQKHPHPTLSPNRERGKTTALSAASPRSARNPRWS